MRELHGRGVVTVTPSWTTRPLRDDEMAATVEHRFVTEEEFSRLEQAGLFLEVVQPFGLPYRYGLPAVEAPPGGRVSAIMVRAPLMPLVARHFPDHVVYQIEDSYDRVRQRLLARGRPPSELGTRLALYEQERSSGRDMAKRVFHNTASISDLADAVSRALVEDFTRTGTEEECAC